MMTSHTIHTLQVSFTTAEVEASAQRFSREYLASRSDVTADDLTVLSWELVIDGKLLAYAEAKKSPVLTAEGKAVFGI